jgi:CARDB protein
MSAWPCKAAANQTASMLCGFWMVLITGGCIEPEISSENPDLIAVPEGSFGGPDAYCDMTTVPQLRIVIQNQGQGNAPASITRVKFSPGGIMDIPTPPLQSAQRTMLPPTLIPTACFDPDCDFTITVDSKAQVNEVTGEENNVTDGRCIRP